MTDKSLTDLVVQVSSLISQINNHPDYQEIEERGYESDADLANAYQAMVDLNAEICKQESKGRVSDV